MNTLGWHSRGYLPHYEGGRIYQFVTFRLHDSLPQVVLERWRREIEREDKADGDALLRRRVEAYLDQGYGSVYLKDERVATLVEDALLFHHGVKYKLSAWVVMPNHVHLLLAPRDGSTLAQVMHSIKSYTASAANKLLGRSGQFWQKEYFDRYVRDAEHFARVVAYIESNPTTAGLCARARDWRFGSAYRRALETA